jgi:DNA repair protein RecN (Recombination protein N)
VDKGRTKTVIEPIAEKQRVEEIARMLGGETITQKTLDHAREMLDKKE